MPQSVRRLFFLAIIGALLIVILGFLNQFHPAFDTLAQFRLHASAGLLVVCLILLFVRKFKSGLLILVVVLAGFAYSYNGTGFAALKRDSLPDKPVFHDVSLQSALA